MNQHAVPNAIAGLPGVPINGGSQPRFYDFDDGIVRLVKWHPCPHGPKGCFNELTASRLGQLIDSPILRGGVVYVDDAIVPADHRPAGRGGLHFAVARMKGENFVPAQHYDEIENSSQLASAAVHLAWLQVGDQQNHNQYLQRLQTEGAAGAADERKIFRLIDMGFMFTGAGWSAASIAAIPASYVLPQHLADKLTMTAVDVSLAELAVVSEASIRACFADCPAAWAVPEADATAAANYAVTLRDRLRDTIVAGNPALANRL